MNPFASLFKNSNEKPLVHVLTLRPLDQDPKAFTAEDGAKYWSASSFNAAFLTSQPQPPLKAGWYNATVTLSARSGQVAGPRIYIPDEVGFAEIRSFELRQCGTEYTANFFLPRSASFFRFDPSIYPCEFSCDSIRLTRIPSTTHWLEVIRIFFRVRLPPGKQLLLWLRKGVRMLFKRGPKAVGEAIYWLWRKQAGGLQSGYAGWLKEYFDLNAAEQQAMIEACQEFARKPVISVITPVYNTPEKFLRAAIESVISQAYPHWELCLADDASTAPHVRPVLEEYRQRDARIKVTYRKSNGHISAASNSALTLATGEFVALLDHDDELTTDALYWVVKEINDHDDVALMYSDEDKLDFGGERANPYIKCDWNYDLFLSHNLITHLGVYRADIVKRLGGFREGFDGSQDYDLALRFIEQIDAAQIRHIPRVLYHWRMLPGSTAIGAGEKDYAAERARLAIEEHLQRCHIAASVDTVAEVAAQRVRYHLPTPQPLVSIIIPTRNAHKLVRQCIDSIRQKTTYTNYEILLVDNGSDEEESIAYFESLQERGDVRLSKDPRPFNFSRLNNDAAQLALGTYLVFLNNDTEVISPDWLTELVSHAQRPEIGAVGARLWYPDDTIQHAGLVLVAGLAGHAHSGVSRGHHGHFARASLIQSLSAVTGACLCIRKPLFEEAGRFDETLAVAFNDVDLCLRLRNMGYRSLFTPYAELYHHESATRGYEDTEEKMKRFKNEADILQARWMPLLMNDPYYSPNLALTGVPFSLAWPPRVQKFQKLPKPPIMKR